MKKCWRMVPTERPSFSALVQSLEKVLETVTDYVELSMTLRQVSEDYEEMRPFSASGTYVGHKSILISYRLLQGLIFVLFAVRQHLRKFNLRKIRTRFRASCVRVT